MEKSEERILKLYFKEGSEEYREAVRRLSEHIPLAYIVGEQAFLR
jgi:methylase of polypeptide subunit release factors